MDPLDLFSKILEGLFCLLFVELLANFVIFPLLNKSFNIPKGDNPDTIEKEIDPRAKGIIERLCIFICLNLGIYTILVAFGALKIATRLTPHKNKVANDYFLIGNLVSIIIVVVEAYFYGTHFFRNLIR